MTASTDAGDWSSYNPTANSVDFEYRAFSKSVKFEIRNDLFESIADSCNRMFISPEESAHHLVVYFASTEKITAWDSESSRIIRSLILRSPAARSPMSALVWRPRTSFEYSLVSPNVESNAVTIREVAGGTGLDLLTVDRSRPDAWSPGRRIYAESGKALRRWIGVLLAAATSTLATLAALVYLVFGSALSGAQSLTVALTVGCVALGGAALIFWFSYLPNIARKRDAWNPGRLGIEALRDSIFVRAEGVVASRGDVGP